MLSFSSVLFTEALIAAQKRKVVPSDIYYTDAPYQARAASFSIAGLQSISQLETIFNSLNQALEGGQTFLEWKEGLLQKSNVFSTLPEWRKSLIYQMHAQTAYHFGQWDQIQVGYQSKFILSLKYVAIMDSRTRPSHAALNGIIRPVNDPFWQKFYPPNGYNCRCGVVALSQEMLTEEGGNTEINHLEIEPDKGFDYHPAESIRYLQSYLNDKIKESTLPNDIKTTLSNKFSLPADEFLLKRTMGEEKFNAMRNEFVDEINTAKQLGLTEAEAISVRELASNATAINNLLTNPNNISQIEEMRGVLSVAKRGLEKLKNTSEEAFILPEPKGLTGQIKIGSEVQTTEFIFIPKNEMSTHPSGENQVIATIHTKQAIDLSIIGIPMVLIEPDNQFYISGTINNNSQLNYILIDSSKKEGLIISIAEEDLRKLLAQQTLYQYLSGLNYESH